MDEQTNQMSKMCAQEYLTFFSDFSTRISTTSVISSAKKILHGVSQTVFSIDENDL